MSDPPKKTPSGEHPAVRAFRDKLEALQDTTLEAVRELNRKLEIELEKRRSSRPPKDPRRDGDSLPPDDVVDLEKEKGDG